MFVRRFETQGIRIYNFRYYCLIRSLPLEMSDMTPFAKDFLFAYVASLRRRHYDVKFELWRHGSIPTASLRCGYQSCQNELLWSTWPLLPETACFWIWRTCISSTHISSPKGWMVSSRVAVGCGGTYYLLNGSLACGSGPLEPPPPPHRLSLPSPLPLPAPPPPSRAFTLQTSVMHAP